MTVMCSLDTDAAIQLADRGNSQVAHLVGEPIRMTNDSAAHNQMIKFEYVYSHMVAVDLVTSANLLLSSIARERYRERIRKKRAILSPEPPEGSADGAHGLLDIPERLHVIAVPGPPNPRQPDQEAGVVVYDPSGVNRAAYTADLVDWPRPLPAMPAPALIVQSGGEVCDSRWNIRAVVCTDEFC